MVSGKSRKGLVVLLLLLVVAAASAAPTMSNCSKNLVAGDVSLSSDTHIPFVPEITEPCNSYLASIGAEFLKPPVGFTDSPAPPIGAKSLPAVPAASLMVLAGFLCVSLVKDRRVWLAALAGLLWASQAGIQTLPRLALRLSDITYRGQQLHPELTYPYCLKNSNRPHSDIEGIQYIGLLRHLAGIPHIRSAFRNPHLTRLITFNQSHQKVFGEVLTYPLPHTFPFPSGIIPEQYSLNPPVSCLVPIAKQPTRLSSAFIFDNLPRGPPVLP